MTVQPFSIAVSNLQWIDGSEDDPTDLCAHGDVSVQVGETVLSYSCCASASALRMLRTLRQDHKMGFSDDGVPTLGEQMLPCCGFNLYADETLEHVNISGCPYGVDYDVHLEQNREIVWITPPETEPLAVSFEEYRREVLRFAQTIEDFYTRCTPKQLPDNPIDRNGYLAFWNEWRQLRAEADCL